MDVDIGNLSDPFVELHKMQGDKFVYFDKTETVQEDLNPDFQKTFKVDYQFESSILYKFIVYDFDDDLKHDFLGQTIIDLG